MPQFEALPNERSFLYSPVAIRLLDTFTLAQPIGRTSLSLQEEGATGPVDVRPFRSADEVLSYPGFGRSAAVDQPARDYRVLIDSEYYEPNQTNKFPVHLYNDEHPLKPGKYAQSVNKVLLQPNFRYPYSSHVPLLRGRATLGTENGPPVEGVELRHQSLEVFTNGKGEFTLPARFPAQDTHTTELSELNKIMVKNARGYARAVLRVAGNSYRVFEIKWKDTSTPPKSHEATLTLDPLPGNDDLPEDLPVQTKVALIRFALLIDVPPHGLAEIDQVFDVSPESGFQEYLKIVIPSP